MKREVDYLKEQWLVFSKAFGGVGRRTPQKIDAARNRGLPAFKIAHAMGIARGTVYKALRSPSPTEQRIVARIRQIRRKHPAAGAKWLRSWPQLACPSAKTVLPASCASATCARSPLRAVAPASTVAPAAFPTCWPTSDTGAQ